MNSEQALVGNLAVAAVVIKTVLSSLKQLPLFQGLKPTYYQGGALFLGVMSAFVVNAQMFEGITTSGVADVFQKIIAGLFIGATAMGVHETTKRLPK